MPRYIDADVILTKFDKALQLAGNDGAIAAIKFCKEIVRKAPTISPDEVLRSKIAPDCPLHELPEHGDLISRNQAFQMMLNRGYQKEAAGVILEVPTVIPSNKED